MQASQSQSPVWHGTTILTVRKGGKVVIGGDGQVSIGQTVIKSNAKKVRKLGKGDVIGGFAGATADAFTLFERLESKLEQYPGQLTRAAVELAKDWRTDRYLRRLEAMMIVADKDVSLVLTGTGDPGRFRQGRRGHRPPVAGYRRRHLCLYQSQCDHRDVAGRLIDGAGLLVSSDDRERSSADPALALIAACSGMVGRSPGAVYAGQR